MFHESDLTGCATLTEPHASEEMCRAGMEISTRNGLQTVVRCRVWLLLVSCSARGQARERWSRGGRAARYFREARTTDEEDEHQGPERGV